MGDMLSDDVSEYFEILLNESRKDNRLRREMLKEYYRYYMILNPPDMDN
ncbi:MAG: hypothetical protein J7L20_01990 [Thermoplasmata archaeon]|nr:hypothetical protein [Thermoplasmata archaeon]